MKVKLITNSNPTVYMHDYDTIFRGLVLNVYLKTIILTILTDQILFSSYLLVQYTFNEDKE